MRSTPVVAALCLLAAAVGTAASDDAGEPKLSPKLEPDSHDKFFDHDYPNDKRPPVAHAFQHPYPIMQDTDEYAEDLVSDDNKDGGEWQVQQSYDAIRGKLGNAQVQLKKAVARHREAEARLADAAAQEQEAHQKEQEALAKARAKEAESDKMHLTMGTGSSSKAVQDAETDVTGRVASLEDSQRRLAKARDNLKALQEARKAAERELKEAGAGKEGLASKVEASIKEQAVKAVEVKQQAEEHIKALNTYQAKDADYKSSALPVEQAASRLKLLRHSEVDHDGGVYYNGYGITTGPPTTPPPPPSRPLVERVWPRPSGASASAAPCLFLLAALLVAVAA